MSSRWQATCTGWAIAAVLVCLTGCAGEAHVPGAAVLPGLAVVSPDPAQPAGVGEVIDGNWPVADGRRLIELAELLDAKNADAPRNGAATGVLAVLDADVQEWLHARSVRPVAKVGGANTAAALRLAGIAVQETKGRIDALARSDGPTDTRAELIRSAASALEDVLELTGARVGLPVG